MNFKSHFRKNIKLAYPVMLSQAGQILVGVADSIMVGQTGTVPLAAVSFSNSVFVVLLTFGIGIAMALTPLVAEADGKRDELRVAALLKNGLWVISLIGILLTVCGFLILQKLEWFEQPAEVLELSVNYFSILSLSLLPAMIFQAGKQVVDGLSHTKQSMLISLTANLVNVVLNYILIYGHLGFSPLGIDGAGYATLISRILMTLLMMDFVFRSKRLKISHFFHQAKTSRVIIRRILSLGIPSGLQVLFEVGAFSFGGIMCGWLGSEALAAHQIAANISSLTYMMASGIGVAATIRVGNFLGKKDFQDMRRAGYSSIMLATGLMMLCGLALVIFSQHIPALYVDDPKVISMAASLLLICAIFQISDGVQVSTVSSLRGLQDVKIPSLYILTAYWVMGLPIGYILAFKMHLGVSGIWIGFVIGLTVIAALAVFRFHRLSRLEPKSQNE
ncbi:MAG: MATE family efflux transporter [Cytophagales bacterium]|nr:MATE family efflux transporter [Cytophagales bacterium]